MNEAELLRYSRHILLPEIDYAGQEKLCQAKVLLVGLGGLGAPAALYLTSSGIGKLLLVDHDKIDLTNLQRQILYRTEDIGKAKALIAQQRLAELNSQVELSAYQNYADEKLLEDLIPQADLVMDGSDNFMTRSLINRYAVLFKKPLVSAACLAGMGQIVLFRNQEPDDPCYACVYPEVDEENLSCAQSGIIAPLAGIMGSMQALAAIQILLDKCSWFNQLGRYDAWMMNWKFASIKKDPHCAVCGARIRA